MAKFNKATVNRWSCMAEEYLSGMDMFREGILTGRDAWAIAHCSGITNEAYEDRTVTDGHVQTALEVIFPNAVFLDRKVY